MTTITIEKEVKIKKTNFSTLNDLLDYLLSVSNSEIEYEDLSLEESNMLNNLKSSNDFKNAITHYRRILNYVADKKEQQTALWSRLDSKQRSTIKQFNQTRQKAA
jgi:hypothetical protein